MLLKEKTAEDLKTAMKAGNKLEVEVIRGIRKALLEKEIAIRQNGAGELNAEQEMQVLISLAKQRKDSIEQFKQGGREDLAENEAKELAILEQYLPKQLSEEEVREQVKAIIGKMGATSDKDIGKVMGEAMKTLRGKVDGNVIQKIAKEMLS